MVQQTHQALCSQVLDVIAPPYTSDFVQLFLPILENDSIAGTIRTEGEHDPVAEFIGTWAEIHTAADKCVTNPVLDAPASVSDAHAECFPVLQLIANPTSSWWTDAEKRPKGFFLDVAHSASDWRAIIATVTNGSVWQRSAAGRRTVPIRPDEWVLVSVGVRDNCSEYTRTQMFQRRSQFCFVF